MNTKTTLSITEARKELFNLIKNIQKKGCYYTLTKNGRPYAVLMSSKEFDSWRETMDILFHHPHILRRVKEARKNIKKGKYASLV